MTECSLSRTSDRSKLSKHEKKLYSFHRYIIPTYIIRLALYRFFPLILTLFFKNKKRHTKKRARRICLSNKHARVVRTVQPKGVE